MTPPAQQIDILDNLNTAILCVQPDLSVSYINDAAESLLATSGHRVTGESIRTLFSDEDSSNNVFDALSRGDTFTKREARLQLNNRQTIVVDFASTPIQGEQTPGVMIIELQPLDRILRISREKALIATQENSRALVRGMAHEIKNPLGGVRGAAQLLAKQFDSEELQEYTNIIIEEADRLGQLVDKMLGSNSLLDLQPLNIHEILERSKQLILAESNQQIEISRDYDPSTPDIMADKSQLIQAVLNIAKNAMQALQRSNTKKPSIHFKTRVLRQLTIGTQRHRLVCHVEVSDNGPGIPEHLQHTLFFPMVSGRSDGSGLGLSIAQSIINHHQGLIEYDSQQGQTTFSIFIPIEQAPKQEHAS